MNWGRPAAGLATLLAILTLGGSAGAASTLPPGFQDSVVISGLTLPTQVAFSPDGRVFVAEKSGIIKEFDSLSDPTPSIFANLTTEVFNGYDRGLLGMALDPHFPTRPYVYVLYSRDAVIGGQAPKWGGGVSDTCPDPPGATIDGCVISGRLARLTASGSTSDGSENVLIDDWCQQYQTHSIGSLAFGPDGALYASGGSGAAANFNDFGQKGIPLNPCGDPPGGVGATLTPPTAEGGSLRSQDLDTPGDPTTLDGTLIRVDPDTGAGLPDNPLAASSDANARRVVAYGLRQPFRFTMRPGADDEAWIGEVGQGTYEEIDRVPDPTGEVRNFGWPCYEGGGKFGPFDNLNLTICENLYAAGTATKPYFSYRHDQPAAPSDGCSPPDTKVSTSISAISFYDSGSYPSAYDGALFFGDYSRNCIWLLPPGTDGLPDPTAPELFERPASYPVQLVAGPGGDLFYVDIGLGQIHRIEYFGGNQPPVAVASADVTSGPAPLTVHFDGSGSSDADNDPLTYSWDLDGDGSLGDSHAANPTWTYTAAGPVTVRLRVTDTHGAFDTDSIQITPGDQPPVPTILTPSGSLHWTTGDLVSFTGKATAPEQGTLPAADLSWDIILHHCPAVDSCHTHPVGSVDGAPGGSVQAPDHEYLSYLELTLTATDAGGLSASTSLRLDPKTVDLSFLGNPAGMALSADDATAATPYTQTFIQGSTVSMTAPPTQKVGGVKYSFDGWSDAGPYARTFAAPAAPTGYTANYYRTSTARFADGFESGDMSKWTTVKGIAAQNATRYTDAWAARAHPTTGAAYAVGTLSQTGKDIYLKSRVRIASKGAFELTLLRLKTAADAPVLALFVDTNGYLSVRNGPSGAEVHSATKVPAGGWHRVQVHVNVAGATSTVEVWYGAARLGGLSRTMSLGTTAIGRVQIGDTATGHAYDVAYDDVVAATASVP
jgi:glucose/arabinose dehydrogenase/PKD repeat protein